MEGKIAKKTESGKSSTKMKKLDFNGLQESSVRDEFRARWDGWLDTVQPGLIGSTVGVPDTQIIAHPPSLTPIELKRGVIIDNRLWVDHVRPAQVRWHSMFAVARGKSWFIIGARRADQLVLFISAAPIVLACRPTGILMSGCSALHELQIDKTRKTSDPIFSDCLRKCVA